MSCIHVIHEDEAWLEPLARELEAQELPWCDWHLDRGVFDISNWLRVLSSVGDSASKGEF